jgi:exopolysaccharide production protein ExoQ
VPPIIALALGLGFIAFLLRLDRRQFPEASRGLWVPTIWLLTVSTKAVATWLGRPGASMEEGSPLDRNFLLLLMALAIVMLVKKRFRPQAALRENVWLLVLFAFMFVSISWSAVPFISLKRWFRETIAIVMGFVILTEEDPWRAIECVVRRAVYILIPLSMLLIKYYPRFGVDYNPWSGARMWIGVTDEKNRFGQLTCFAAFFLIWSLQRIWKAPANQRIRHLKAANIFILLLTLYMTKGSKAGYSATALVMLAVALMVFTALLWLKRRGQALGPPVFMILIGCVIVYGTLTPLLGRLPAGDITSSLGRNSTLTDRTLNWAVLVPVALSKPVLGHGVGGFWTSEKMSKFYFPAHNGYLEVLLVLGFVGLLLMSIYLITTAGKAQRQLAQGYEWGVLWICWMVMALLNNIAESSLNSFANILMVIPLWMTIVHHRAAPPEP